MTVAKNPSQSIEPPLMATAKILFAVAGPDDTGATFMFSHIYE